MSGDAVNGLHTAAQDPSRGSLADAVRRMADDPETLTAIHLIVEDELIDMRDRGISIVGPANGLVVKYQDGTWSDAIRMGTREAVELVIKSLADMIERT